MSVFEATMSFTKVYTRDLTDEALWRSMSLTYAARRNAVLTLFAAVLFIGILYLYLVGSVVAMSFAKESLQKELEVAYASSQATERALLLEEGRILTEDFFASEGYSAPQTFETLTRSRNVAEISNHKRFY